MGSRCDVSDTGAAVLKIVRGENVHQNVECSKNISDKLIGFKIILPLLVSFSYYILYM